MYFKEIVLAGLFHDIGKFYQKGNREYIKKIDNTGKHPTISKDFIEKYYNFFDKFVDVDVLIEVASRHHESSSFPKELLCEYATDKIKPYCYLVSTSDNLSSSERDEKAEKTENYKTKMLDCVFNRINRNENTKVISYNLDAYNCNSIFPNNQEKNDTEKNSIIINKFTEEFDELEKNPPKSFNDLVIVLDNLFKKYLWAVPSSTIDNISDVSLYDHSKTTSAIASALYLYHNEENSFKKESIKKNEESKFLLLGINIPNIEKYILSIADYNVSDTSKRLRARSFFVDLLLENINHNILNNLGLTIFNKIMSVGGKSYLLIPNTKNTNEKVVTLLKDIERNIFTKFKGDISIQYDFIEMNKTSFKNYSKVIMELSERLDKLKTRQFSSILTTNNNWVEDEFLIYKNINNKTLCPVCRNRIISKELKCCKECDYQFKIGTDLPKSKYVLMNYSKDSSTNFRLVSNLDDKEFDYAIKLDGFYEKDYINKPVIIKNTLNYVPIDKDENTLSFDEISKKSKGCNKLGAVKFDIDNLGMIFKEGFKFKENNLGTMSRTSTMSRMIDIFFTEYVRDIINTKYPYTYCVYYGGDDLILISTLSDISNLVIDVYNKFFEFVGQNNSITISSSVVSFSPKTHISQVIENCNKKLTISKQKGNSVYFIDEVFSISDFKYQINQNSKAILSAMKKEDTSIFRRIQKYSQMYREFLDGDTKKLRFVYLLNRDIKRNYNLRNLEKYQPHFYKYIVEIEKNSLNYDKGIIKDLYFANTIIKYCFDITKEN